MKSDTEDCIDEAYVWGYQSLKHGKKKGRKRAGATNNPNIAQSDTSVTRRTTVKNARSKSKKKQDEKYEKSILPVRNTDNKAGKRSNNTSVIVHKEKQYHTGNCPVCQMPFSILQLQSPSWHVAECMELPLLSSEVAECPAGAKCDVTIESHYRKFRHSLLADIRSGRNAAKICDAGDKTEDKETPIDQAKRKLTFSSLKATEEDPISSCIFECEEQRETVVDTPVDIAKKKLNFSENKNINDGNIFDATSQHCTCDKNMNLHQTEFDIDQAKRKLSFNSTRKPDSNKSLVYGHSSTSSAVEMCGECFKPKNLLIDIDSPYFLPINVDTPHLKCDVKFKIESVVSLSENVKELSDGSDKGYQSDDDIFKDADIDDELLCNIQEQESADNEPLSSVSLFGKRKMDRRQKKSIVSKNTSLRVTDMKDENMTNSQKSTMSQLTPRKGIRKSLNAAVKDEKQPSIFSYFRKTPHVQDMVSSSLSQHDLDRAGQSTSGVQQSGDSDLTSSAVLDNSAQKRKSCRTGKSEQRLKQGKSDTVLTYRFTRKTALDNLEGCEDVNCDLIGENLSSEPIPPKLRKKSVTESVTSLLSGAIHKTKSALDLLRQTSGSSKPWPLTASRTSKAGTASTSQASVASASEGVPQQKMRKCPFYKKIPGTPFTVDAFNYGSIPGCTAYFLSHFHYDHYGGLRKSFAYPLYCTKVTANLVKKKIRVDPQYIKAIDLNTPTVIEGVEVTLLEANHCPGSVLMLFKLRDGTVHLHTGDFRATQEMTECPELRHLTIDTLFLDTTYCDSQYSFPPQRDVIQFSVNKATEFVHTHPNILVVVGSYTIGKERIFLAIAEALNVKVCVTREKKGILDCLEDASIDRRLTLNMTEGRVHVLPMKQLNYTALEDYLGKLKPRFDRILAFEPTGWTHSKKATCLENIKPKIQRGNVTLYGVPYSEHSSYTELKSFTQITKPKTILPTVNNGNPASRKRMEELFTSWMRELEMSPRKQMKQGSINGWLQT